MGLQVTGGQGQVVRSGGSTGGGASAQVGGARQPAGGAPSGGASSPARPVFREAVNAAVIYAANQSETEKYLAAAREAQSKTYSAFTELQKVAKQPLPEGSVTIDFLKSRAEALSRPTKEFLSAWSQAASALENVPEDSPEYKALSQELLRQYVTFVSQYSSAMHDLAIKSYKTGLELQQAKMGAVVLQSPPLTSDVKAFFEQGDIFFRQAAFGYDLTDFTTQEDINARLNSKPARLEALRRAIEGQDPLRLRTFFSPSSK